MCGIAHKFQNLKNLRPACFIAISDSKRGRHRKPACPDGRKTSFFDNTRRKPIVCLANKLKLWRQQQLPKFLWFSHGKLYVLIIPQKFRELLLSPKLEF